MDIEYIRELTKRALDDKQRDLDEKIEISIKWIESRIEQTANNGFSSLTVYPQNLLGESKELVNVFSFHSDYGVESLKSHFRSKGFSVKDSWNICWMPGRYAIYIEW